MNNCALICEYNPFHSGHKYQLDAVRSHDVDNIYCIMSGSFVQSAMPAFCDKALRARCAVLGGCDAVIELPTLYATSSAGFFARGGVKIASKIPHIKMLAMGATASRDEILYISDIKIKRKAELDAAIKKQLDCGKSYNYAVSAALAEIASGELSYKFSSAALDEPNNMLCIEYICAINELAPNLEPLIIKPIGATHNNSEIDNNYRHISATAIRNGFCEHGIKRYLPYLYDELSDFRRDHAPDTVAYEKILLYALKASSRDKIKRLRHCSEGMENMFDVQYGTFSEYSDAPSFRRFGKKRLRRLFLDAALDAKKEYYNYEFCTRLLACQKDFDLSLLPQNVFANNGELKACANVQAQTVLGVDERASSLYNTLCGLDGGYRNYSLVKV